MSLFHYLPEEIESEIYKYAHGLPKALNEMKNLFQTVQRVKLYLQYEQQREDFF